MSEEVVAALKEQYGLDKPLPLRYLKWMRGMLRGDFGVSWTWGRPVSELVLERLPLTVLLSLSTLIFTYVVAIPIGIYSAVNKYSIGDYLFTGIGFLGLAIPNFLLALVLMYVFFTRFGISIGGLFSPAYENAPWSFAKFRDMLNHLWVPIIVIGTSGTAGLIRKVRALLLDELGKDYVRTARAKGLKERTVIVKHAVRIAINPILSTIGWHLPGIISGSTITSIVLNLPTTGPLLLRALQAQDMYLAGSFVFWLSMLTVIGTFLSDLLLAWSTHVFGTSRR